MHQNTIPYVMLLFLHELLKEDDHEHGRHHKVQALRIKGEHRAQLCPEGCPQDPVAPVEQRHPQVEPAPVDSLGRLHSAVDGEALVTHAVDEDGHFPAMAAVFLQHGQAVKQVPRLDEQRHQQRFHRREGAAEHLHAHVFQRAAEDGQRHHRGKERVEAAGAHEDAIGHAQEQKARHNRDRMGEGSP